jgi:hypothetical protein
MEDFDDIFSSQKTFEERLKQGQTEVLANWFLNPRSVLKLLKIRIPLDQGADFQELKVFPWGILGYDHEEGLKFSVELDQAKVTAMVNFVKAFYRKHQIHIRSTLQANTCSYNSDAKGIFLAAGLKQSPEFSHVFIL